MTIFSRFIHLLFLVALVQVHTSCTWAFSSCREWGLLSIGVCRLLIAVASLGARGLHLLQPLGSRVQSQ